MDDLTFSNERSEFSTDGPVNVRSKQIELSGFGLILLFDTVAGRIEYLHIRDLETLRISNAVEPRPTAAAPDREKSSSATPAASASAPSAGTTSSTIENTGGPQETAVSSPDYYECIFDQNVEITYGNELVISGADQVNIQNILFSTLDSSGQTKKPAGSVADKNQPPKNSKQSPQSPEKSLPTSDSAKDIIVHCDGGVILQPISNETSAEEKPPAASNLSVEMRGAPLRVMRIQPDAQPVKEPRGISP